VRRVGLEAQEAHPPAGADQRGHLPERLLRRRRRELAGEHRAHLGVAPGAGRRPPVGRGAEGALVAVLDAGAGEVRASRDLANPGRRDMATARTSTSSSTPAARSASRNESTVAPS
jgi:hypothetical protein